MAGMRTCYCEKCNYEFDILDELNEDEDMVFCPRCKINLARILPETPSRIILREQRLARIRRKEIFRLLFLVLKTLAVVLWMIFSFRVLWKHSLPFLLSGALWGYCCAMWTRFLTLERTPYSGTFSMGLMAVSAGLLVAGLYFSDFCSLRAGQLFEMMPGLLFAYFFAAFEKEKLEP